MRRRGIHRTSLVALSALVASCKGSPAPPVANGPVVVDVPADAGAAAPLVDVAALREAARAALLPYARPLASPPPSVFYTWTTDEQITDLDRDRVLLTRDRSPVNGTSFFERELAGATTDPIATLVRTKAFAKVRFAWSAPWATLRGWPGETYGQQLIGVTLKSEAWIAVYVSSTKTVTAIDLQGNAVPAKDALQHPERLGAVSFVHDGEVGKGYREYVLCNESMIAKFSVGTDDEKKELASSIAAIKAFSTFVDAAPRRPPAPTAFDARVQKESWSRTDSAAETDPYVLFEEALALPSAAYLPDSNTLHELLAALEALPLPSAHFSQVPLVKFQPADAALKRPPPPPQPRRPLGTY